MSKFDEKFWKELDTTLPGWQSENEARFLIENIQGDRYVEIGVAYGKSLILVEHHYGLDMEEITGIDLINHGVDKILNGANVAYGDSVDFSFTYDDETIDTLFIDGDHTYEGVKKDIEAWYPKVKKGGTIIFHDYQRDKVHEGVQQAVDEIKDKLSNFRYVRFIAAGEKN